MENKDGNIIKTHLKIDVDTTELDAAIEKAERLKALLEEIQPLQERTSSC